MKNKTTSSGTPLPKMTPIRKPARLEGVVQNRGIKPKKKLPKISNK